MQVQRKWDPAEAMILAAGQVQMSRLGQCTGCGSWAGSGGLQKVMGSSKELTLLDPVRGNGMFGSLVGW